MTVKLRRILEQLTEGPSGALLDLAGNAFRYDSATRCVWSVSFGPVLSVSSAVEETVIRGGVGIAALCVTSLLIARFRRLSVARFTQSPRTLACCACLVALLGAARPAVCAGAAKTDASLNLRSLSTLAPEPPPSARAQQAIAEGNYKGAIHILRKALKFNRENSQLLTQLGVAYARLAEMSAFPSASEHRARKAFEQAIAVNPKNNAAWRELVVLTANPVNGCSASRSELTRLARQWAAFNPEHAFEAYGLVEGFGGMGETPESKVACAPLRTLHLAAKALP